MVSDSSNDVTCIICVMKRNNGKFAIPAPPWPLTKNGVILGCVTFLFATTFLLLSSSESSGSLYSSRGHEGTSRMYSTSTGKGQYRTMGHIDNASSISISVKNILPRPVTKITHGCYTITQSVTPIFSLLNESELRRLNCEKREPAAIIIGTKKSGTTTLKSFLSFHPEIAFAERELKFVNNNQLVDLEGYRSVMPYATQDQIPMEKTPGYFIRLITARRLQQVMPHTKFIIIVRNPVKRAISDYVHMRYVDGRRKGGAKLVRKGLANKQLVPRYEVVDTFADSVLFPNGSVREYNSLLDSGLYAKYLREWFRYFPRDQFLVLDGEVFVKDPAPAMSEVERFLGVSPYFTEEHFYFEKKKGFFCLKKPLNTCMKDGKGRPHPEIDDDVITKLTEYFRPHDKEFELLLNRTFSWS